ncbi:hypothetical protein AURDEDRAFT_170944 [Auricularia subglabra TFB-10046 SS5]|nr:hypothetical protein AURDEDRAFT_170944 [Auricularia subglabra TFB-10046 SS5]
MRFQFALIASIAAIAFAAPEAAGKQLVERFEPPIVPRGCADFGWKTIVPF